MFTSLMKDFWKDGVLCVAILPSKYALGRVQEEENHKDKISNHSLNFYFI